MPSTPRTGLLNSLSPRPEGVVFDYGNTLIPFGQREMDGIGDALTEFLVREVHGATPDAARSALRETFAELARERAETRNESDPKDVIRRTFRRLGASADEDGHVAEGRRVLDAAFVDVVRPSEGVHAVLGTLRKAGYRLGLLSNYSSGVAIRNSMDKIGIAPYFDVIVVSADMGIVKPHPELFLETARRLSLVPASVLFVGDKLRADIQGAAAVGMSTAHITEHLAGRYHFDHPDEDAADVRPDLVLERLTELTGG